MLDSFVLVLTLCGSLSHGSSSGGYSCESFVLDTEQTEVSCLRQIETVHNQEKTKLYDLMSDAGNDWFKKVESTKLHCIQEDKE